MEVNLVGEALKFMALGMGVVFTFLIIMIFVLKAQAAIIGKYFTKEPVKPSASNNWQPPKATDNKNVVAAITAAILHHNHDSNKKG